MLYAEYDLQKWTKFDPSCVHYEVLIFFAWIFYIDSEALYGETLRVVLNDIQADKAKATNSQTIK